MYQIDLTITAQSPLAIGRRKPGGSVSEAEDYIPGTVIRGAIAAQILRQANPQERDFSTAKDDFQALFLEPNAAIFRNAYPTVFKEGDQYRSAQIVKVLPATALSSKTSPGFQPTGNGVFDTLMDRFCAEQHHQIYDPNCPKDGGRVEPFSGFYSQEGQRYYKHIIEKRLLTRVGINRRRATAEDQILYSTEVLTETLRTAKSQYPATYCGAILLKDKELAKALIDFINQQNFRIGGSASRGLGRVKVEAVEGDAIADVESRIEQFNSALIDRWKTWKIFSPPAPNPCLEKRCFFTLNLQSEAILTEQWRRTTVISAEMLQQFANLSDKSLKLEAAYSSYDYRSGWNSAWGLMKDVELVTNLGAVYLFSVEESQRESWIEKLAKLEEQGVGDRTSEGFGQIKVCDDFHLVFRERVYMSDDIDPKIELQIQKGIRQAEDQLVLWIQTALDNKKSYGNLEESQFRNLVSVADTTESPEVVKNFLRYQVGREDKWGRGKGSLAETIILDIGAMPQEGNILNLAKQVAETAGATHIQSIWMELIRRYLGYGARYLKYLNDGQRN